jgi:hypothetical protein
MEHTGPGFEAASERASLPAVAQLDAAIAAAREHQRLGDAAASQWPSPDPDTHYLAGILSVLIAFGAILQEEAS